MAASIAFEYHDVRHHHDDHQRIYEAIAAREFGARSATKPQLGLRRLVTFCSPISTSACKQQLNRRQIFSFLVPQTGFSITFAGRFTGNRPLTLLN
jgi:hypothetical protein